MSLFLSVQARRRSGLELPSGAHVDAEMARRLADGLGRGDAAVSGAKAPTGGELMALERLGEGRRRLVAAARPPLAAVLERALERLEATFGAFAVGRLLALFAAEFSLAEEEPAELLRELLLFALEDRNPVAQEWMAVLHEGELRSQPLLAPVLEALGGFLEAESIRVGDRELLPTLRAGEAGEGGVVDLLRAAWRAWGELLGADADELLRGVDLLAEEQRQRFPPGPGPIAPPDLGAPQDARNLSSDHSWMAELVLQAKNVQVWLHQLSRRYGRPLSRLDEIPDAALAELAAQGMSGLWLIGVWERSAASAEIKRRCGNPEALASAYSLRCYRVAEELGGDAALAALAERAAGHGLRLGADMVPNHLGIDSDWVLEHPERFIGLDRPPFPGYRFDGPDLSPDGRVALQIEDRYYDRSDAAVVFRRTDRESGEVRYLYHGNDGTSTPWNDTAQLDFLRADVREAVLETILAVARRFPVVRFDAAMTLARQHFRRLWYPPPGHGGAIPSRAEHGLTEEEFDRAMPEEFWRTVVERLAAEAPDTLLLAEAFWLMEGYFVRTLGMHRVYNSAFMHMMRDRANAAYRAHLREALAFDREVLKRYVNFMSNPDEETARGQFGDGERYLGVASLMATLPGLPMFAHGQVEGLREKYGMEYAVAYHDESPDAELVAAHRQRIVPLLRCRDLTGGIEEFLLFDLVAPDGRVEEDVIAFGNGTARGRILVLFNNSERRVAGSLRESAPFRREPGAELETRRVADLWRGAAAGGMLAVADPVTGERSVLGLAEIERGGWSCALGPWEFRAWVSPVERVAVAAAKELGDPEVADGEEAAAPLAGGPDAMGEETAGERTTRSPRELLDADWARGRAGWERDSGLAELEAALAERLGAPPDATLRRRLATLWTLPLVAARLAAAADSDVAAAGSELSDELVRLPEGAGTLLAEWSGSGEAPPAEAGSSLLRAALEPEALDLKPAELGARLGRLWRRRQEAGPASES